MNQNMLKRLMALENLQKTVSPICGKNRNHEHIAGLLTDVYGSLWDDGAVMQRRNERYHHNLTLVEQWSHSSLVEKLEKYQGLFQ